MWTEGFGVGWVSLSKHRSYRLNVAEPSLWLHGVGWSSFARGCQIGRFYMVEPAPSLRGSDCSHHIRMWQCWHFKYMKHFSRNSFGQQRFYSIHVLLHKRHEIQIKCENNLTYTKKFGEWSCPLFLLSVIDCDSSGAPLWKDKRFPNIVDM